MCEATTDLRSKAKPIQVLFNRIVQQNCLRRLGGSPRLEALGEQLFKRKQKNYILTSSAFSIAVALVTFCQAWGNRNQKWTIVDNHPDRPCHTCDSEAERGAKKGR